MPPSFRTLLTILLLLFVGRAEAQPSGDSAPAADAEDGHPFIKTFSPADYDAAERNWAVVQDGRGVVYAGNESGVLEYDGAAWRLIELANHSWVRSLAVGPDDRVWVGGIGELGYLAPDELGRTAFFSLRAQLRAQVPAAYRDFDDVWGTHVTDEGTYFRTRRALFRWDGETMSVWPARTEFHASAEVRGTVYVREWDHGLLRLERTTSGESLRLVPGGERFAQTRIYAMLPFDDQNDDRGRTLIGTREEGLFIWDGGQFEPFETEADAALDESGLYTAAALPGGRFALGTRWLGLLVIDREGRLLHHLDQDTGLPDDTVLSLHRGESGNLWIALSAGLSRVELTSPFTRYGEEDGVTSTPTVLARHEGRPYAANMHGGPTYFDAEARAFRPIPDSPSHSPVVLAAAGDLLVAGSNDGVHRIRGDRIEPVRPSVSYDYIALALHAWHRDPRNVFVGLNDGLALLRRDDAARGAGWIDAGRVPGVDVDVRRIAEAPDGTLWLGTQSGRVVRLRLPGAADGAPDLAATEAAVFGEESGLPPGALLPYRVGNTVYISTRGERLFRFDEARERFVEDTTFAEARSGHPLARFALRSDDSGRVWIASAYSAPVVAHPRADGGGYTFERLHRFRRNRIHDVYPEADGTVWLMGSDEIIRYDARRAPLPNTAHPPLVRRVVADTLLYGGAGAPSGAEIPFRTGEVRFAYAAPGGAAPPRYRTRLEGFDENWSAWTSATERVYANLPPGDYRFFVEAEDRSQAAAYGLTVLPPWYRTWWASSLFGFGFVLLVFAMHSARTRHLRIRKEELDAEVAARTRELQAEKRKTEEQAERLREMDRLKSRFFTNVSHEFRTPLTLTIGPLEDIQTYEDDAISAAARRNVDLALRNSRRLLRLINQLLDIAKLDAGDLRLNARRYDLGAFVRDIARSFAPLAERRRVRFTVDVPETPEPVRFDGDKLEQVLANVLSNAFKFTPEGGAIHVSVAKEREMSADRAMLVRVRDSGPGIPADALVHVFDRFYQAGETHSEVQVGTGIGLSLAKDLVELHGGTISAESAVGFGTTFTIRLPRDQHPDAPPDAPLAARSGASGTDIERSHAAPLSVHGDGPGGEVYSVHRASPASAGDAERGDSERGDSGRGGSDDRSGSDDRTTVLIADDNAEIRTYVRSHLEPRYRVLEAADGRVALEAARSALPDLVVSDVMMPHMDGFALIEALRADRETDFIPVVLLTARASETDKVRGLSGGADAYLHKPFKAAELLAHIESLIASRQRLKRRFASEPPAGSSADTPSAAAMPSADVPVAAASGGALKLLPSEEAYVARARAAVQTRLSDEEFSVEELASALEQSRSTLHRRLRELLDRTPTAFIREIRLERAADLLRKEGGTVSEIAYAVGFKSVSHFCQSFREAYGATPSAYLDEVYHDEGKRAEG